MDLAVVVAIIASFLIGAAVTLIIFSRSSTSDKISGTLHIYISDEDYEPPYLFVELENGLQKMVDDGRVTLNVSLKTNLPQK